MSPFAFRRVIRLKNATGRQSQPVAFFYVRVRRSQGICDPIDAVVRADSTPSDKVACINDAARASNKPRFQSGIVLVSRGS